MPTMESLRDCMDREEIGFVDLRVADLAGRWRHVTIPAARFCQSLLEEGVAFDGSNFGYAGVEGSDLILRPDLDTVAIVSQGDDRIMSFICDILVPHTMETFEGDPRAIADRAERHLREEGVAESVLMSPEFEFYVFRDVSFHSGDRSASFALEPINLNAERTFYHACPPEDRLFALRNDVCRQLANHGIEVKYHHHEVGAYGQLEIELGFLSLRDAADVTMIVKNVTRTVAAESGLTATFLPKPIFGGNGSGLHVHQYLQRGGVSLFEEDGGLSDLALCYIGGILTHGRSPVSYTHLRAHET